MGRELHIKSDRAYELATRLAAERGASVEVVIEQALEALDRPAVPQRKETKEEKLARWMALLEEGWKHLDPGEDFRIEDLYDPETGLPA